MKINVKTECPECKQGITFTVHTVQHEDTMRFFNYQHPPTQQRLLVGKSRNILDCKCGKDFIAKIELEAHVTTRKIAETEEGGK